MSNYFFGHLSSTPSYIESLVEINNYEDLQDVKVEINIERHRGYTISKRVIRTPAGILRDAVKIGEPIGPYGNCPYPHHLESILKKHEDLDRIRYLLPSPKRASFADIPIIKKIVGDNGLVSLRLEMGTDAYLADACGQVGAMTLYFDDKELLITLLRLFNDYIKSIIKMALEVGVDMVTDCWFNSSLSSGWSPAMYQELALPLIKGPLVFVILMRITSAATMRSADHLKCSFRLTVCRASMPAAAAMASTKASRKIARAVLPMRATRSTPARSG